MRRSLTGRLLVAAVIALAASAALAADKVTIALSNGGLAWDFSVAEFGKRLGYFAEEGIDISVAGTDNLAESLQAVVAGNVEVANVGVTQFLAAAVGGAPIKLIGSSFLGTTDWLWYVRSDSPLKSFKELTEASTIGVTSFGSSQFFIVSALLEQYGVKAQVVQVGSFAAGMMQVMSGQIDVGSDGNGLLGVPQFVEGKVRPIAYGRELELLRDVSVRGLAVNARAFAANRDLYVRFLRAYQRTVTWMYENPKAVEWFAERTGSTLAEATRVKTELYPPGHMDVGDIRKVETSIEQGIRFKRLTRVPTSEELATFIDVPWKPAAP